jgi:tetratricopeptide (TPR) repeat protein
MDAEFKRLMGLLAGYPLAMEVVLANLAKQSTAEILAALNAANVDLNVGGDDKTNNILKCVEYSHSNLSPQAQKLLVCLAPFNGFFVRDFMPQYAEHLQQYEAFQTYDFSQFDAAIQEAINWGLLSAHESSIPGFLSIQPIFPFFLSIKLNDLDEATRFALNNGFNNFYRSQANTYHRLMESQDAQAKKGGAVFCRLEYENLYNSLKDSLHDQEDLSVYRCLSAYLFFANDIEALLNLTNFVCKVAEGFSQNTLAGDIGFELGDVFQRRGVISLRLRDLALAESSHLKSIDLARNNVSATQEQKQLGIAANYHQLGYIYQLKEDYKKSLEYHDRALKIQVEYKDFWAQAKTYHHLGILAYTQGEDDKAREYYQKSLDIKENELNDPLGQASTLHQMGMLSQTQGNFKEAERYYQKAIFIKRKYGDSTHIAETYGRLGTLYHELEDYGKARDFYQKSLDILIRYGDIPSQAFIYSQLALLAEDLNELEQAKAHYLRSLQVCIDFDNQEHTDFLIRSFARLYQTTQDNRLLAAVAQCLSTTPIEVQQLFAAAASE